ncbi:glycerate kinase [Frankineae bacterium MT45]|nr:glycerate kinase [Frankineae bacterium MT45]
MRVLIASDKFKGSLTSAEVAHGLAHGMRRVDPSVEVIQTLIADGGDGTIDAALAAGFEACPVEVPTPLGDGRLAARFARRGPTALVELAEVAGTARLPDGPEPLAASTLGVGLAIRAALDAGCTEIIVGLGGSCSTDGGAGILLGLGAVILDAGGRPVPLGAAGLSRVASVDLSPLRAGMSGRRFIAASDVTNPLLGPAGAAHVFGPQKGASAADLPQLDAALANWADVLDAAVGSSAQTDQTAEAAQTDRTARDAPGAGAAGGSGYALRAALDAELVSGAQWLLELIGFSDQLAGVDLVITGEGSLDTQSLGGKASVAVAQAARAASVPVVAACGINELSAAESMSAGFSGVWALHDLEPDLARCRAEASTLIITLGEALLREYRDPRFA